MQKFGIDISMWQGEFDFGAAIAEGAAFAILKGGGADGGLYVDPKFTRNYDEAKRHGLPVGVYFFSMARTVSEAEREAEFFRANVLDGRKFELPVYVDVEHSSQLALGKRALTDVVHAWCAYLEERGYFVGIYSSTSFFRDYMNDSELTRYAHWAAEWSKTCTYPNSGCLGMWQFGGETNLLRKNTVAGVVCDQNYMLADYPAKIKAAGRNGFGKAAQVPSAPASDQKSVDEIADKAPADKEELDTLASEVLAGKWGNGAERKSRLSAAGYDYAAVQSRVDELLSTAATGATPGKSPASRTYTVKSGDTLWSIAQNLLGSGARYTEIMEQSGLTSETIFAGQVLRIPE